MKNFKLSPTQLFFFLIHSQIGLGVIALPYQVFLLAGRDGWLSVIFTGIFIQIIIIILSYYIKIFPEKNFYEIIHQILGKWLGKSLIILYYTYFIVISGIFLSEFANIMQTWLIPLTPKWVLLFIVLLIGVYLAMENLFTIAQFFILSSLIFLVYIGFSIYSLKESDITYILPVAQDGLMPILKGMLPVLFSYKGFGYFIFLKDEVEADQKSIFKALTSANVFVTLFYTLIVFACLVFLSPRELVLVPEPVLYLVKSFAFKIVERPDLLFTSIWIVIVLTTLVSLLYISSLGLAELFKDKRHLKYIFITAILIFVVSFTRNGVYEIKITLGLSVFLFIIFDFLLPILILLASILLTRRWTKKNE